jgi:hypothetical protein
VEELIFFTTPWTSVAGINPGDISISWFNICNFPSGDVITWGCVVGGVVVGGVVVGGVVVGGVVVGGVVVGGATVVAGSVTVVAGSVTVVAGSVTVVAGSVTVVVTVSASGAHAPTTSNAITHKAPIIIWILRILKPPFLLYILILPISCCLGGKCPEYSNPYPQGRY